MKYIKSNRSGREGYWECKLENEEEVGEKIGRSDGKGESE
jgi:hypothetical protein